MKILYALTHSSVGGVQKHVLDLANHMKAAGHDVWVTCAPGGPLVEELLCHGISYFPNPHFKREISPIHDTLAFFTMIVFLRKNKFDVVHSHGPKAGLIVRVAAWISNIPINIYTHHLIVFKQFKSRMNPIYHFLEKIMAKISTCLVAVSEYNRQELIRSNVGKAEEIHTIHNGIYGEPYLDIVPGQHHGNLRDELGIADSDILITMVARMEDPKDPKTLLNAFCIAKKRNQSLKLAFVGDGPLRNGIERTAKNKGLADDVYFLGFRKDIPAILGATDVFVLSTRYEGLPICIIEAMFAARPVIATDVAGNSEMIVGGETGFLVPVQDASALAEAIGHYVTKREDITEHGRRARDIAMTDYTVDVMCNRIEDLYSRLAVR